MKEISTITANGKQLRVIYSKQEQGLHLSFSSDERIREYIFRNTEEAFCESVTVDDEGTYWLNIASTEDFGAFEWKSMPELLDKQLSIFMPIIQKFIEGRKGARPLCAPQDGIFTGPLTVGDISPWNIGFNKEGQLRFIDFDVQ